MIIKYKVLLSQILYKSVGSIHLLDRVVGERSQMCWDVLSIRLKEKIICKNYSELNGDD